MSNMKKLFNLAKKAMDSRSTSESGSQHGGSTRGSTDWRSMVHKAAEAVTGESREHSRDRGGHAPQYRGNPTRPPAHARQSSPAVSQQDRAAIARYNYLLETADPRQLEQVPAEAFAKLTPTQRALLQQDMNRDLSPSERPASAEPSDLARAATRSEVRNPGSLRRLLARSGGSGAAARSLRAPVRSACWDWSPVARSRPPSAARSSRMRSAQASTSTPSRAGWIRRR